MKDQLINDPTKESQDQGKVKTRKPMLPPYWAKRKKKLQPKFLAEVIKSYNSTPVTSDEYGEYREGTFLHDACVVSVKRDKGMWFLHIISEGFVSLRQIKEIRYTYLPDKACMAMLFPTREEDSQLQGILLYEVPSEINQDNTNEIQEEK